MGHVKQNKDGQENFCKPHFTALCSKTRSQGNFMQLL